MILKKLILIYVFKYISVKREIALILFSLFFFSVQADINNNTQKIKSKNLIKKEQISQNIQKKHKENLSFDLNNQISGKEYLVKKLDYLNRTLPKNNKAENALKLRLAHTLSLISENNFLKFEKDKCLKCEKRARDSAIRSLFIYKQLDPILSKHSPLHITALFRQAYLERLLGNKKRSIYQLIRIANKRNTPSSFISRAWYNIGEIYFESYEYKNSLQAFNQVLKIDSTWSFKATYRKIWSLFNLSLYKQSITELITFLKSDLYSRTSLKKENQFLKEKLETELITLYSYGPINNQILDFIYNFNKKKKNKNSSLEKNQRLFDLAKALNRIGRLVDSNIVWTAYLKKIKNPKKNLLAYYHILDNYLTLGSRDKLFEVGKKVEEIFALQKEVKAYKADEMSKKIRQFFNQVSEKALGSKEEKEYMLSLYGKYNSIYLTTKDTLLASAMLAEDLNKYKLAGDLLRELGRNIKKPDQIKLKENISIKQMELAELTKDDSIRSKSYEFYIKNGINPALVFKAKYQMAYLAYNNKDLNKANDLFSKLALYELKAENKIINELKLKSAHLSLSALDQLGKQEEQLVYQAGLFMSHFPDNRREFSKIYNTAILNTVKKLVSNKNFSHQSFQVSTDKDVLKAWDFLNLFATRYSAQKDLSVYYLDKLLLAKELLKFDQMDKSIKFLLANKNLSAQDRKVALTWKLWLAELRFDFKEVLKLIKVLNPSDESEEHLLRLAKFSKLANLDSTPYYKTLIKNFPNSSSKLAIVTFLIENSSSKKEKIELLKKYANIYEEDSNKLTYLILKIDEGQLDSSFINFFIKLSFMKNSFLYTFEKRRKSIDNFTKKLKRVRLNSLASQLSGYRFKIALEKWTKEINDLNERANALLKTQDWTTRVFILSEWKKELKRFYNSVLDFPPPKELTEEEKQEYKTLLVSQMQVYAQEIKQLKNELNKLWSQDFLNDYKAGLEKDIIFYPPLKWELDKLAESTDGDKKKSIQALLDSLTQNLKNRKIKKFTEIHKEKVDNLYKILKKNPFDKDSLTKLFNLEKKRQNTALSFYLSNRIKKLSKKGNRNHL